MLADNWNKYEVKWNTRPGPGATYYEGTETVWAENRENAALRAQREVVRRAFPEYSPTHIRVNSVKEA